MIYTDGSGFEGVIGASAVLYQGRVRKRGLKYHLGTTEEHTVYKGELVGITLGLHIARTLNNHSEIDSANISLDNQLGIQATHHRKPQPSQYLLEEIQTAGRRINEPHLPRDHIQLGLTWVRGHEGVEGNEAADAVAEEGAQGSSSPPHLLPPSSAHHYPSANRIHAKASAHASRPTVAPPGRDQHAITDSVKSTQHSPHANS
jgi:ribonuclease HI